MGEKRDEEPCILAGGEEEEEKLQHPGFARPLLLFPVQEKEKNEMRGPASLRGEEGEKHQHPRPRSSIFAFVARGGRGKKEMRSL